ncbi:MFS transporter [Azospirillum sp. ST 5-10]|uniref:MFS transporter n=1 Tax=unclassified Azospirillum TaxID=2630922 RepID=UPI003F4A1196
MSAVNVSQIIANSRLGGLQLRVIALCTLCMIVDGFDVQAMGYVAPALIKDWGIEKAVLGPVFGAALLGMTLGALALGTLADRVGRRPVLVAAMLCLAATSLATAWATSVEELRWLRFLTGLCMGAIVPNAVALAGEFSPARLRITLMMVASSGFILGGAVGGAIAGALIPSYGWESVFVVGAAAPLLLGVAMLALLPESIQYLAVKGRRLAWVRSCLARIDPGLKLAADADVTAAERGGGGASILELFRGGMAVGTLLLWLINFMNLLAAYFLANWLPVIMTEAGHATSAAVLVGTVFWVGGLVGNLLLGWLVDRHGFGPTLAVNLVAGALGVALIGQVAGSLVTAGAVIAVAGFCILGGQSALNALAAAFYPTAVRSTGAGWALGIGRLGSIFGPVIGGELMRLEWTTADLLLVAALPCLVALACNLLLWLLGRLPHTVGGAVGAVPQPAQSRA